MQKLPISWRPKFIFCGLFLQTKTGRWVIISLSFWLLKLCSNMEKKLLKEHWKHPLSAFWASRIGWGYPVSHTTNFPPHLSFQTRCDCLTYPSQDNPVLHFVLYSQWFGAPGKKNASIGTVLQVSFKKQGNPPFLLLLFWFGCFW